MSTGRIVSTQIARADLLKWGEEQFGDWIKAVVDMSRGIMAVGGDLMRTMRRFSLQMVRAFRTSGESTCIPRTRVRTGSNSTR